MTAESPYFDYKRIDPNAVYTFPLSPHGNGVAVGVLINSDGKCTFTPEELAAMLQSVRLDERRKARRKRPKRSYETTDYLAAARRFIRAAGRRVADADEIELAALIGLADTHREAVQTAVDGMRARGLSWAYIASATGTSREAAYQKWGKK